MFCIDTFAGTPKEIGRAWGRVYRHLIQALYWEGNAYHSPHPVESEIDAFTKRSIEKLQSCFPAYLEEVEAASRECGLSIEQMAMRINGLCYKRGEMSPDRGCFQIGVISDSLGPIVGSIMDSSRVCFIWWRLRPAQGYAHLSLSIPGTAAADRGMNEHGLVVSESSTPNTGADYEEGLLLHALATRLVLEQCRTVGEAIELMTSLPVSHAYVFADAQGNMAGLQTTPVGHAVYEPEDDVVLANHVRDPKLLAKMIEHGYDPDYRNANSEKRVQTAVDMLRTATGDHDFEFVRSVLSSHEGYPDSICCDGNATSFIAMPRANKERIWIAERFPCLNPFLEYSVL